MPIPENESRARVISVGEAYMMALHGEFVRGFDHLHLGLAQAKGRTDGGAPWAQVLVKRWQQEIDLYCEMFGVYY